MGGIAVRVLFASLLLAGCGKVSQSRPDAGNTDDAGNTTDADPTGNATVVTEAALFGSTVGAKVGNIDLVSNLPDNSMLAAGKTDASGGATIKVYTGGSVTAIYKHTVDLGADLITWVGVKPGDTLIFGSRNFSTTKQPDMSLGMQNYSWPALTGTIRYGLWTTCNNLGSPVDAPNTSLTGLAESSLCHRDPMTVLYAALDGTNALIGYGSKTVTFANGATVALAAWNTPGTATVTMNGLPTEVSKVSGNFRVVVDSLFDFTPSLGYNGAPTGGAFTTTNLRIAAGIGLRALGAVVFTRTETEYRPIQMLDAISLGTLTQTLASPALPPWTQTRTSVIPDSRIASWILIPTTSSVHKGQLLRMKWDHTVAGTPSSSQWDVILPPGQMMNTFGFPALPAALGDSEPTVGDSVIATTRVFDIPSVKDYDTLRTMRSANLMCLECAVRTADFPRVVFTDTP